LDGPAASCGAPRAAPAGPVALYGFGTAHRRRHGAIVPGRTEHARVYCVCLWHEARRGASAGRAALYTRRDLSFSLPHILSLLVPHTLSWIPRITPHVVLYRPPKMHVPHGGGTAAARERCLRERRQGRERERARDGEREKWREREKEKKYKQTRRSRGVTHKCASPMHTRIASANTQSIRPALVSHTTALRQEMRIRRIVRRRVISHIVCHARRDVPHRHTRQGQVQMAIAAKRARKSPAAATAAAAAAGEVSGAL
jgi:hypothetical protein